MEHINKYDIITMSVIVFILLISIIIDLSIKNKKLKQKINE